MHVNLSNIGKVIQWTAMRVRRRDRQVWLALNEVSFGWSDWWVFEVVVEGAAGDVVGEGYSGCVPGHFRGRYGDGPPPWGIMGV